MKYSRVYVEITNICNMSCSFCHGHSRRHGRMSEEEFALILDRLSGQTEYVYYHLMGEPLTHPLLPRFLRMAAERGFRSIITTNGTLLAQRGDELIGAGVHKVSISVHSFEQGSDAAFQRYMSDIADFAEKASQAGVIVVLRLWNNGCDDGLNSRVEDFLRSRLEGEWAENTRGVRIHKKLHLEWGDRFDWPDPDAPVTGDEVFCYGLRDHFGILLDGSVVPCCMDCNGDITLGNIFRESLEDILGSPRAGAMLAGFDRRTASEELCRRCGYARRFL
ncbi:MAG: radical SAM protein [Ruminococcaceae bacterium]|nr:radical SAM protein [Oscillospiraceae bacterium]